MKHLFRRSWLIASLTCVVFNAAGQIHGLDYWDHWQLGDHISVNFPSGQAGVAQYDTGLLHREVVRATICDPLTGDILFSYDGDSIRGADNLVMANGALGPTFTDYARWIAHPGDGKIFFVFAKSIGGNTGWRFSTVHRDNGILPGEANVALGPYGTFHIMEAISSPDGTSTWAVTHDMMSDAFRVYRISSPIGLDTIPTVQHVGPMLDNTGNGYLMRVSPDNTKLALVHYIGGLLTMFDIDPTTGILSNVRQFHFAHNLIRAEFSSSSRYLYLNGGPPKNAVDQIDLAAGDSASIMLSETTLPLDTNRFKETPRLGTDGRIYIAMDIGLTSQADRYARILEPDQPGLACNTDTAGLVFPNYSHNPLVWNYWPFTPSYLGTTEYQAQANKLRAWPVPSRDDVSIDLGLAPDHASVLWIDAAGRTVRTQLWPAHTSVATFDRGSLPSGAYIIDVRPENSSPRRAKVMLE